MVPGPQLQRPPLVRQHVGGACGPGEVQQPQARASARPTDPPDAQQFRQAACSARKLPTETTNIRQVFATDWWKIVPLASGSVLVPFRNNSERHHVATFLRQDLPTSNRPPTLSEAFAMYPCTASKSHPPTTQVPILGLIKQVDSGARGGRISVFSSPCVLARGHCRASTPCLKLFQDVCCLEW